jgi:hypothetical protein
MVQSRKNPHNAIGTASTEGDITQQPAIRHCPGGRYFTQMPRMATGIAAKATVDGGHLLPAGHLPARNPAILSLEP